MKILINCSNLKKGGVLQVGYSVVSELLKKNDHEYFIIFSSLLRKNFLQLEETEGKHFYFHDVRPTIYGSLTGRERRLNQILKEVDPDAVFSLYGPTYWKPDRLHLAGYAKASYFYPDSPFIQQMPLYRKMRLRFLKALHLNDLSKFNQALVTQTNDASGRLAGLLPAKKVFVVSNTYNQIFENPGEWDPGITLPEFEGITLLSITANYRHKNLGIIPGVVKYLKGKYPFFRFRFVLTLTRDEFRDLDEETAGHIVFLGRVTLYQCPPLYNQSDLMFMPTLLECFSATYPESMKMNVPVLTSDMPFARDVCGDAALYFDPLSPESIGEAIYAAGTDPSLRRDLVEKGIKRLGSYETFESRANKYIHILESLHEADHSKPEDG